MKEYINILCVLSLFFIQATIGNLVVFIPSSSESFSVPVYSAMKWRPSLTVPFNMTLVYMHLSRDVFDYCNLNAYNANDVRPLLKAFNVSANDKWAAIQSVDMIEKYCSVTPFDLAWPTKTVIYLQNMGATINILTTDWVYPVTQFQRLEGQDLQNGIINGELLVVPSFYSPYVGDIETIPLITAALKNQKSIVTYIQSDYNPMSELLLSNGSCKITGGLALMVTCIMQLYTLFLLCFIVRQKRKNEIRFPKMAVLCGELLNNFSRMIFFIDPIGVYTILDYKYSRLACDVILNLSNVIKLILLLVWFDFTTVVNSGIRLRSAVTLLRKPWVKKLIVSLSFLFIVIVEVILLLYYDGTIRGSGTAVSATVSGILTIVVSLLTFISLFFVRRSQQNVVGIGRFSEANRPRTIINKKENTEIAAKSSSPGDPELMTVLTLKMDRVVKLLAASAAVSMTELVLYYLLYTGFHTLGPNQFVLTLVGMAVINILTSFIGLSMLKVIETKKGTVFFPSTK